MRASPGSFSGIGLPQSVKLPARAYQLLMLLAFGLVLLLLPGFIREALAADAAYRGTISTRGDAWEYQTYAINLAHGKGWDRRLLLPLEAYHLDLTTPFGLTLRGDVTEDNPALRRERFYRAPG